MGAAGLQPAWCRRGVGAAENRLRRGRFWRRGVGSVRVCLCLRMLETRSEITRETKQKSDPYMLTKNIKKKKNHSRYIFAGSFRVNKSYVFLLTKKNHMYFYSS